jgi:hypothetical protein
MPRPTPTTPVIGYGEAALPHRQAAADYRVLIVPGVEG